MKLNIHNHNTFTEQSIYDYVCEHLAKQGRPSVTNNICAYRSDSGTSCAVGCLVADDDYKLEMEGISVTGLFRRGFLPHLKSFYSLLAKLQGAHDSPRTLESLQTALIRIATAHDLTPGAEQQIKGWEYGNV